ncbi:peripheral-type benzodiazepine receptor-associated 1-like protein, putative [Babesia ovata]|uniref:Peripheral-type benzodiazepine receptor-associated 1-like protein, putative n=1 Tax=Babesia ovata TaxID=189622 RepID=A0A2H6K9F2_9APIC|nr:peripheral-type benzodiazepine receptor-associated 1-like protein, putative [Babesia ovata]GBE59615.1 peripheral-type benzodiazepine receptor-associated 1-like protein, putative [Babesia ovata]
MSSSLRALMRREKAARRGANSEDSEAPAKVQAVAPRADSTSQKPQVVEPRRPSPEAAPKVLEESFELVSDSEDSHGASSPSKSAEDRPLGSRRDTGDDLGASSDYNYLSHSSLFRDLSDGDTGASMSVIEGGNRLYDDINGSNVQSGNEVGVKPLPDGDQQPTTTAARTLYPSTDGTELNPDQLKMSDDVHIYDQLNTAFSSRIEYERQRILGNVDDSASTLDYGVVGDSSSTITSANFGKSNMHLSTDVNLPDGFFDNKRSDAQARGKMTGREASEKLSELERSQAELLNEARYVQEKYVESWQERHRLMRYEQEHQEAVRELSAKVDAIKSDIADAGSEEVLTSTTVHTLGTPASEDLKYTPNDEDSDDFSWRMKAFT